MIKKDYFEYGETVTGNTSVQQIKNLRKAIKAKRRHKLTSGVLLMQDNPQVKNMTSSAECGCEMLSLLPYSPDPTPSDYYLLPKMKYELRRKWFESNNDVMVAADEFLGMHALAFFSKRSQNSNIIG